MVNKIIHALLFSVCILISIGYHPAFFNESGENIGNLRYVILGLILFTLLLQLSRLSDAFKSKFIKNYTILLFLIFLEIFTLFSYGFNSYWADVKELSIPLILIIIGYNSCVKNNTIKILTFIYILSTLIIGFEQIRLSIGGFIIQDTYIKAAKNSLGAMLAIAGVGSIFYSVLEKNKWIKILLCLFTLVSLIELLTIRARLATLAFFIVFAYIIFIKYKAENFSNRYKTLLLLLCFTIITILLFHDKVNFAINFVKDSFFQNKEYDLLSGRGKTYEAALHHLSQHPLWGNLNTDIEIPWIHNYLLLKLFNYGFLGGVFISFLYLYLIVFTLRNLIHISIIQELYLGFFLLCIPIIISLGEPTFPYGPGTVGFLPYLILGMNLQRLQSEA